MNQCKISIRQPKFTQVLDRQRRALMNDLAFTQKENLYLGGGTSLALYLNHRTSVDFDFYSPSEFAKGKLVKSLTDNLKQYKTQVIRDLDNTFELDTQGIRLSCFYYPYPLIRAVTICCGVKIASLEDIAAMKAVAVAQRGHYRDFVDLYYLLDQYNLKIILKWTSEKYPNYNLTTILKGLIYFAEAEENINAEKERIKIFDQKLTWRQIKNSLSQAVIDCQEKLFAA